MGKEEYISTRGFVEFLYAECGFTKDASQFALEGGYKRGWLEQQDLLEAETAINRRSAARILHNFLRIECGEADTEQWQVATKLQDLYDCRVCVNHVAQMFAKGIMTGLVIKRGEGGKGHQPPAIIFGMAEPVTNEEALLFVKRLRNPKLRLLPEREETTLYATPVKREAVAAFLEKYPDTILVDVRTRDAYEKDHWEGAIHLSMNQILTAYGELGQNGQGKDLSEKITENTRLLLYCDMGYQSEIAANCLTQAGYREVYYVE